MFSELWLRADRLMAQALERSQAGRRAFVEKACEGDGELHREVLALLEADEAARTFLERPMAVLEDQEPAALAAGDRLGPYRLVRVVEQGGMGTVYLGERDDDEYRHQVAVKVIRGDMATPEFLRRFRTERQVLASLTHPNIARLYDGATTEDGRSYFVMEWIEGVPIDAYCDQNRLSVDERLVLFRKVCGAVEHAHRNLVVHCDLKPANILVTPQGIPKLLDFGIAKLLDAGRFEMTAARTRTGLRPLTPLYASPEQIHGEAITTASDTYSLGVLLYRLLTGRRPYRRTQGVPLAITGREPERPSEALVRGDPPAPDTIAAARKSTVRELQKRLRGDLDNIVLMTLRREPERRFGSVRELADDLERHLTDRPVTARPDTHAYRLGKFVRRNTLPVVAGSTAAAMLVGFSLFARGQSIRIAEERDLAQYERNKAQQVSGFFMELFEQADPAQSKGEDLTVREVLDWGRREIDRLAAQPELQAAYMSTIGRVYLSLGLYEKATPMFESALELRRRRHGAAHDEVAESLTDVGRLLRERGEYESAEAFMAEALEIRRRLFGSEHLKVAESLRSLGSVLHNQGKLDAAEALFREAMEMGNALLGNDNPDLAPFVHRLATVLTDKSDYENAESLYRKALEMNKRLYGDLHLTVATSLNDLAYLLHTMGQFEDAESLYREALEINRKIVGDEHRKIGTNLNNLASLLEEKGDWQAAEPLLREALEIERKVLGKHPAVTGTLNNLAMIMQKNGDLEEAERLYREAIAMRRELRGEDNLHLSTSLYNLATLVQQMGDLEGAEPLYREALELDLENYGNEHTYVAISATGLANLLCKTGRGAEAERRLRDAIGIFERKLPEEHWRIANAGVVLGACLTRLKRFAEAEGLLLESYSALKSHIEQESVIQDTLKRIVEHYEQRGLPEKATEYRALISSEVED